MTDGLTTGGVLVVLESYPKGLNTTSAALPRDTRWFAAACRRWGVPAQLLLPTRRINALDAPPSGDWLPVASARVSAELVAVRPRLVVAAGWVAREASLAALSLPGCLPWAEPRTVRLAGGQPVELLAVPHFSGRSRALNCPALRAGTSRALRRALEETGRCQRGGAPPAGAGRPGRAL